MKAKKKKIGVVVGVILGGLALCSLLHFGVMAALIGLLAWSSAEAKVEVYTDISDYKLYMGEDAEENYRSKWGMDETIFPENITDEMAVEDYKMVYYNPWDAQFLSYLVVQYDEEDYQTEIDRLKDYASTDYLGNYGVTGFDERYTLLAMYADEYYGFVYALTDNVDTIIYTELIFCNYFMDLKYQNYMPAEYFPVGFDATVGNEYGEKMLGRTDE